MLENERVCGGDGGIRTLDTALGPYNGLANRRLQPLGHVSCGYFDFLSLFVPVRKPLLRIAAAYRSSGWT